MFNTNKCVRFNLFFVAFSALHWDGYQSDSGMGINLTVVTESGG